ncbi:hypothetical protein LX36DRAFT_130067 [Colletotrichum falcatum]|nr:hypothetical protein LX36DRAFT_130067 [Colletotrichum falcatum]
MESTSSTVHVCSLLVAGVYPVEPRVIHGRFFFYQTGLPWVPPGLGRATDLAWLHRSSVRFRSRRPGEIQLKLDSAAAIRHTTLSR